MFSNFTNRALKTASMIPVFILSLFIGISAHAGEITWDGPYVSKEKGESVAKWVSSEGKVETRKQRVADKKIIKGPADATISTFDPTIKPGKIPYISKANKFVALSDIHGQNHLVLKLFKLHGVINDKGNWAYGKGKVIVVGDILDRGPDMIECLWMLYKWSHQAAKVGGGVYITLGNHECMVMGKSEAYLHEKNKKTAEVLGVKYWELLGENTVLGEWLRSMPIIIQVNDTVFTHAGIAPTFIDYGLTIEEINTLCKNFWHEKGKEDKANYKKAGDIRGSLTWYRDYFKKDKVKEEQIDQILALFKAKRIVVGHTTQSQVKSLFNGKVIAVDSGLKGGKRGELLSYENGVWTRCNLQGEKLPFLKK